MAMDASALRRAWIDFFSNHRHTVVPSAGLIPHHPTAPMFTNAGMNQFVPYFLDEEPTPYTRALSVQKCVRLSGKHNDIDELGKTRRHLSFFEMLGNWSFGDYFKEEAIVMAWELCTEVIGFDGDRLWATVHTSDDAAEAIWRDTIGLPGERIQRLGDKENFWEMGETGPCGPSSEIHYDCGPEWGEPGGPAAGGGDRYVEFWNLVFMDQFRHADRSLTPLPKRNVDTGGGLERFLMLLDGVPTVFDTDALRPMVAKAESLTGHRYKGGDEKVDTALRVIGDHARTMTFLVNDGVTPSNEGRGYVLRGVIRRAVRRAYQLGVDRPVLTELVATVVDHMGDAYPELRIGADGISAVVEQEEGRFRSTLRAGSALLEAELDAGQVSGDVAFRLHDTYGFPIEITEEVAEERGIPLDRAGFDAAMEQQRLRSRAAGKVTTVTVGGEDGYRKILDGSGVTDFRGYRETESQATVVAVLPVPSGPSAEDGADGEERVEVFLDRTPFYAEGGGQVGDTGSITSSTGTLEVLDTTYAIAGLIRHLARPVEGEVTAGQTVTASVDSVRRDAIRRNHTGTHLLHWALREVLGPHVMQQGSLVSPDYLRFDFRHHGPLTPEQVDQVERLVNERVLANEKVRAYETSMDHAREIGATMFFEDKYGELVRVVEAGGRSIELCGGTHVDGLGMIGTVRITSEASIGANLRRVFALTGAASLESMREQEAVLERAATLVRTKPESLPEAVERLLARQRELEAELKALRSEAARGGAAELVASAVDGCVVARVDGLDADGLRELATAVRADAGVRAVVLIGTPDGARVALVAAVDKTAGLVAGSLLVDAAKVVGGGGNAKAAELAVAGGKDAARIDEALDVVRSTLGL